MGESEYNGIAEQGRARSGTAAERDMRFLQLSTKLDELLSSVSRIEDRLSGLERHAAHDISEFELLETEEDLDIDRLKLGRLEDFK